MAILGKRKRTGRPVYNKKKKVGRMMPKARLSRGMPSSAALQIKRTFRYNHWNPGTAATSDFWRYYVFTAADMPSFTEFQPLFDLYRIAAIKVQFRPRYSGFYGNDTTDTTLPGVTNQGQAYLNTIIDGNVNTTAPSGTYTTANLNTFLENGRVKTRNANRPVTVYFKPTVAGTVAGISTRPIRSPWLGTDQTGITHRGFHAFVSDINMTGVFGQAWDTFVTYYIQFKSIR